jgi:sterol 14-demethylase
LELVEFMKQLTINTASHCLLGREFRYELSGEFADIYHDLEQGVSPIAYHFPYLPIPKFKRRDRARLRLQGLVSAIVRKRASQAEKPTDLFQSLIDMRYEDGTKLTEDEITGMLIAAIFAGHHTSSGTAAWVLLELLKHPALLHRSRDELDGLLGADGEVTFQSLRDMPTLENVLKEVLRLHPPLIILMRKVSQDLIFKQYTIKAGDMIWACPPLTHRLRHLFENPSIFDPDRYSPDRREDKNLMAYQPFGGGKHKCSGNAFATFQIKAIFAVLLRKYEFALTAEPSTYVDDYTQMIVQPKSPCRVKYRRREVGRPASETAAPVQSAKVEPGAGCPFHAEGNLNVPTTPPKLSELRVVVDRQLCQGHAMCMGEAPDIFKVHENGDLEILKPEVSEEALQRVENAVRYCPNSALKIERVTS